MKPKLTFLLSLIFLFLFSGSVYADDLQEGINGAMEGDYKTALEKIKPLADKGDAEAQRLMGLMYLRGEGVSKNYTEALKWYRKSAEQENIKAQVSLGNMYLLGQGVQKDYKLALKWNELAAKKGNAIAQGKLAMMYFQGYGVTKNYKRSVKWSSLSAKQGDPHSQWLLGFSYAYGKGVTQNFVEAYKWFYISKSNGIEEVKKSMETIKNKMSSNQIAKAESLANEWLNTNKQVVREESFKKYRSTVGVLSGEFIKLTKNEKRAYVRGVMDGEYIFANQNKNRELKILVTCLNEQLENIISSSQEYTKTSLKSGQLMPWPLSTLVGQVCEKNLKGEMPDYKSATKLYDLAKMEGKESNEEDKNNISRNYVRGVLDGSVFYLHGHFYPKINEYLECLSKPKTLDYTVSYFNAGWVMGTQYNPYALSVFEAVGSKCPDIFK